MNNPEMYKKFASYQKQDAEHCLKRFNDKMNWQKNAKVIDLGSGDGSVTQNILKRFVPADFKEIVGVDISEKMVEYANKEYGDDRTKFQVMNISGDVPEEFKEKFDHAFSSYVLHFLPNLEKVFGNVRDLLKEGGTCAIVFNGRHPMYDVFIALSKQDKWSSYMRNINDFVTRFHYLNEEETENEIRKIVKQIGCINVEVHCEQVEYVYESLDLLIKMLESANCFNIPSVELQEFMEDFEQLTVELKAVEKVKDNSEAVRLKYWRIEFFGQK